MGSSLVPDAYCLVRHLNDQGVAAPWVPRRSEGRHDVDQDSQAGDQLVEPWCMSEVDIFADLSEAEMEAMAHAAPMRRFSPGELIYAPQQPGEQLFILKQGRVRIFRVSSEGRALTTAIVAPGTIFGEMVVLGQRMHDNFAEALDEVTVCVMSREDVRRFLLSDARIAARISETLGQRVSDLERRLSDNVFKSAPQRVAATLCLLARQQAQTGERPAGRGHLALHRGRGVQVNLTHEQVAALAGASRETTTKSLNDYAELGLVRLGRGRVTVLDVGGLARVAGD